MSESKNSILNSYQTQRGTSILTGKVIVVLAMACLGFGYAQFLQQLGVSAAYLTLFCLILSIEAILTQRRAAELEGREKWIFRLAEILTIAILLKAFILLHSGIPAAWKEIQRWQSDILSFLENGDYLASILILASVWFASTLLAGDIDALHDREQDTSWDELGKIQNSLHPIRNRIANTLFTLGGLVVFFAIGARLNVREYVPYLQGKFNPNVPLINVLFYFVLVLILLSQSQLALLRTRWLWNRIPVSPVLTRRWILYGGIFFSLLACIVFFMPTNYSMGFLETFWYAMNLILAFFRLLLVLILMPLTLCASLFNSQKTATDATPAPPIPQLPTPTPNTAAPPFWQFIQSLLFWSVIAGVVIFALSQYFRANRPLLERIVNFPLTRWLTKAGHWIWTWIRRSAKTVEALAISGFRRLSQVPSTDQNLLKKLREPGGYSSREQIIQIYLALLESAREKGIPRKEGETPYQYSQTLITSHPEISPDVMDLTSEFVQARYSQHDIAGEKVPFLRLAWERILEKLQDKSKES